MVIYKYPIMTGITKIDLPIGAKFLRFGFQDNKGFAWFEVNSTNPKTETRKFAVIGTGDLFYGNDYKWLDTVLYGQYVWHLYEIE